ncbi:MAG TPA: hypothetical protein VJ728_00535, partial [Candidatus Binataceae bacterium]|nr:hypothetical protein [Candidatus Binataceae bacterium]
EILHDERTKESLSNQVLALFEGYRALVTDLIGRAQAKGMCVCSVPATAAAGFLLAALNGLLLGHLFLGSRSADLDTGMKLLRNWLFGDTPEFEPPPRGSPSE